MRVLAPVTWSTYIMYEVFLICHGILTFERTVKSIIKSVKLAYISRKHYRFMYNTDGF